MFQVTTVNGPALRIQRGGRDEMHAFASAEDALARAAIIEEAFSWIGTPFVNCGDVKGRKGAVDCAMLLVRCFVDTGRLAPFDPRPYPAAWMLHQHEERFLGWVTDKLGAREIDAPMPGSIAVYRFGRCFSHGGIVVNSCEIVHAFVQAGMVILSRMDEHVLRFVSAGSQSFPRAMRYFDVGGA